MESKSEDSIQVYIRVKPGQEEQSIVQFTQSQIHLDRNHFGFDKIFPPSATQSQIFQAVGTKLISHTLDGYNGCIFVYGQTGSGKTYTMIGQNNGIMQRSFLRLFQQIQQLPKSQCTIYCSYYQIYNEQIIDLLDVRKDKKLNIRQDLRKGVFVQNLVQETVLNQGKLLQCLNTGMRNRHVGETMMNRQSSRSHSIFTISFAIKTQINGSSVLKTPKLHFVDLAGSQRQKMTAASGDRLKQAGNINKSLTTLGMVINALASQKTRTHIPYRDSKLTCLLRDSLGGNSKTFLIATISRNLLCFQQTLSTLNFANRAKMVKVKALVNQQSLSTNIQTFKEQIKKLKAQIARLKSQKKSPTPSQIRWLSKSGDQNGGYDNQFKQINDKISVISDHLIKNSITPSLQQLLQQIKNLRPVLNQGRSQNSSNQIMDETIQQLKQHSMQMDQLHDQQDPLIQYLSCNNSMLQKIHAKIDEYQELKEQLRSLAYNNQLQIAKLKTPSKFQREQYESLLFTRDKQILDLHTQLKQLRNLVADQQLQIQQSMSQVRSKSSQISLSQQITSKYEKQRFELQRQVSTLRNLMIQSNQQIDNMSNKYQQAQRQAKQNKQLYIFAEENYSTEKHLRDQIQKNLMLKICQLQELRAHYTEKIQEQKQYCEQMEERLKEQINILTQTVQFNQNLVAQYKQKFNAQKTKTTQLQQSIQHLQKSISQLNAQKLQLQQNLSQTILTMHSLTLQLESTKQYFNNQITAKRTELKNLQEQYKCLQNKNDQDCQKYGRMLQEYSAQVKVLKQNVCDLQENSNKNKIQYQNALESIQSSHNQNIQHLLSSHQKQLQNIKEVLQQQESKHTTTQKQLQSTKQSLRQATKQIYQLHQLAVQLKQEHQTKLEQVYQQTKDKLQKTKILQIQNQELKKQYRILQKQNYKIKAKYSDNNNKSQEELALKVDYYQQKFRLMSIQYQKAMQVVKKLKQKQINQAQKIVSLQETQKLIKMSYKNDNNVESSLVTSLSQQNSQLKKQLYTLKSSTSANQKQQSIQSYMNKMSFEQQKTQLKQKQEYFKTKIQESIKRWDPSKENVIKARTLEDLICCWQELECQSIKKLDAITKGIKKEQKIKTQNSLILKENIYLKEQISSLQKNMGGKSSIGHPRKIVKLDMENIPQDSMQ